MKTALALITIVTLIGVIAFQTEYLHPRHIAALRADYQKDIDALDNQLDNSLAERDHLEEQLSKAQADLVALAGELKAAQAAQAAGAAGAGAAGSETAPQPQPTAATPAAPPVTTPPTPAAAPAADQIRAQMASLRAQLAAAEARQQQVQDFDPQWQEQRIDRNTGRKSGIRTSDADRQKLEAQRTAELQRVGNLITDLRRRIAALESQLAR